MRVRLLRPGEAERAAELDNACQGAAHWTAGDYLRLAGEAAGSARFCLVAVDDSAGPVGDAAQPAGLLVASAAAQEAELLNLAVAPGKRRRGVATALLVEALRRMSRSGAAKVWLEVRASNQPAIAFYLRQGFEARGRRRDYYQAPREDALVLARAVGVPS